MSIADRILEKFINVGLMIMLELNMALHRLNPFKRTNEPSLIAYNIVWFTNCTWLEQLYCFKQLDEFTDKGKGDYLVHE